MHRVAMLGDGPFIRGAIRLALKRLDLALESSDFVVGISHLNLTARISAATLMTEYVAFPFVVRTVLASASGIMDVMPLATHAVANLEAMISFFASRIFQSVLNSCFGRAARVMGSIVFDRCHLFAPLSL
jgi:hypothetical protein